MINMSAEDLNRTYHGTYVGYRDGDVIKPFFIDDCCNTNELRGRLDDSSSFSCDINDERIVLSFPDSGVYQIDDVTAAFVARRAQRQWHRGVREQALSIRGSRYSFPLVKAMFNPKRLGWETALRSVSISGFRGAAIDKDFWLEKNNRTKYPLILFRDRVIGEVVGDSPKTIGGAIGELFKEAIK